MPVDPEPMIKIRSMNDDPQDHVGIELDHAPLPIDLLPDILLENLKEFFETDRTERLIQTREVLVTGA